FEKFYEAKKIDTLSKNLDDFLLKYQDENWSDIELYRKMEQFSAENNARLYIANKPEYISIEIEKEIDPNTQYLITVAQEDYSYFDIVINNDAVLNSDITLKQGQEIYLEGIFESDEVLMPTKINDYEIKADSSDDTLNIFFAGEVKLWNYSVLTNITKPTTLVPRETMTIEPAPSSITMSASKIQVPYNIYRIPYTNTKEVSFTKMVDINGSDTVFMIQASLQSVDEAFGFLTDFYVYFYMIAIIISFILAFIFSRVIGKPIVKMTHTAKKMSDMDFTSKVEIKSGDELGIMAESLNTLSSNLENSMKNLENANDRLKEENEKILKQERFRKDFIANASHEFKTPLGVIKGFAETIKRGIKKEKTNYYLDVIVDETEKMNDLVVDMLLLSKLDDDNVNYKFLPFKIKKVIEKVVSLFENEMNDKLMTTTIDGEFFEVYGDEEKIERAFINLMSNAIKYGDKNSVIKINGKKNSSKNIIEIENDCKDFCYENIDDIWERFYKGDESHQRDDSGTGLGLSIVKSILDVHDEKCGVYPTKNGVQFYFSLSIYKREE
ncbi:MAG: HAMP domain-containing histidine kinase, partial [Clostridia bacterium]|nr:HAMP domain-containing histidine kinase [Clostridia bacterium]